jgi:hypothetical protein
MVNAASPPIDQRDNVLFLIIEIARRREANMTANTQNNTGRRSAYAQLNGQISYNFATVPAWHSAGSMCEQAKAELKLAIPNCGGEP